MDEHVNDFNKDNLQLYYDEIDKKGLTGAWDSILNQFSKRKNKFPTFFCKESDFPEMYEIGLAHINKIEKKELGKYYTPEDVADVMAKWLVNLEGENVVDVCCGCGNLIIRFLSVIGEKKSKQLLRNGNIFLYDVDSLALKIAKQRIALIYGTEYSKYIKCKCGDFLSKKVRLPRDCKVISNPPYHKISNFSNDWDLTENIKESKELYSAFYEKIIKQSKSSVIISPHSFISGEKFYSLRTLMNNYSGFIVSFDNVPGSIFNGKKKGIFNSNATNSVRAAISVIKNCKAEGFKISPLIRFKNSERKQILNNNFLEKQLGSVKQKISVTTKKYGKCPKKLEKVYDKWIKYSEKQLSNYISEKNTEYLIVFPNTCRYFTVAASINLERKGKYQMYLKDQRSFVLTYAFLNSSFAYLYWRIFDGGITYTLSLLESLPVFFDKIDEDMYLKIKKIVDIMMVEEKKYIVKKKNAGEYQNNIKFPKKYRDTLNEVFLNIIGINNYDCFEQLHSNQIKEVENSEN